MGCALKHSVHLHGLDSVCTWLVHDVTLEISSHELSFCSVLPMMNPTETKSE